MRLFLTLILLLVAGIPVQAANNILVFGDSLSAGYGIPVASAWPSLLQERLRAQKIDYNVVNLSISGETTSGGKSRLPAALAQHKPAVVIIALGANDGLRGLPLEQMQANLQEMITATRNSGAKVLLVGIRIPPNYGPYAVNFQEVYPTLARELKLPFVKFLLEGIADKPGLFQADGLHPIASAQTQVLDNVWKNLLPLLKKK